MLVIFFLCLSQGRNHTLLVDSKGSEQIGCDTKPIKITSRLRCFFNEKNSCTILPRRDLGVAGGGKST